MAPFRHARQDSDPPPYDESTSNQRSCRNDNTRYCTENGNQIRCPSYEESMAHRSDQPPPYADSTESSYNRTSRVFEMRRDSTNIHSTNSHQSPTTRNTNGSCRPSMNNRMREVFGHDTRDNRAYPNCSCGNGDAVNRRQGLSISLTQRLTDTPKFRELFGYID